MGSIKQEPIKQEPMDHENTVSSEGQTDANIEDTGPVFHENVESENRHVNEGTFALTGRTIVDIPSASLETLGKETVNINQTNGGNAQPILAFQLLSQSICSQGKRGAAFERHNKRQSFNLHRSKKQMVSDILKRNVKLKPKPLIPGNSPQNPTLGIRPTVRDVTKEDMISGKRVRVRPAVTSALPNSNSNKVGITAAPIVVNQSNIQVGALSNPPVTPAGPNVAHPLPPQLLYPVLIQPTTNMPNSFSQFPSVPMANFSLPVVVPNVPPTAPICRLSSVTSLARTVPSMTSPVIEGLPSTNSPTNSTSLAPQMLPQLPCSSVNLSSNHVIPGSYANTPNQVIVGSYANTAKLNKALCANNNNNNSNNNTNMALSMLQNVSPQSTNIIGPYLSPVESTEKTNVPLQIAPMAQPLILPVQTSTTDPIRIVGFPGSTTPVVGAGGNFQCPLPSNAHPVSLVPTAVTATATTSVVTNMERTPITQTQSGKNGVDVRFPGGTFIFGSSSIRMPQLQSFTSSASHASKQSLHPTIVGSVAPFTNLMNTPVNAPGKDIPTTIRPNIPTSQGPYYSNPPLKPKSTSRSKDKERESSAGLIINTNSLLHLTKQASQKGSTKPEKGTATTISDHSNRQRKRLLCNNTSEANAQNKKLFLSHSDLQSLTEGPKTSVIDYTKLYRVNPERQDPTSSTLRPTANRSLSFVPILPKPTKKRPNKAKVSKKAVGQIIHDGVKTSAILYGPLNSIDFDLDNQVDESLTDQRSKAEKSKRSANSKPESTDVRLNMKQNNESLCSRSEESLGSPIKVSLTNMKSTPNIRNKKSSVSSIIKNNSPMNLSRVPPSIYVKVRGSGKIKPKTKINSTSPSEFNENQLNENNDTACDLLKISFDGGMSLLADALRRCSVPLRRIDDKLLRFVREQFINQEGKPIKTSPCSSDGEFEFDGANETVVKTNYVETETNTVFAMTGWKIDPIGNQVKKVDVAKDVDEIWELKLDDDLERLSRRSVNKSAVDDPSDTATHLHLKEKANFDCPIPNSSPVVSSPITGSESKLKHSSVTVFEELPSNNDSSSSNISAKEVNLDVISSSSHVAVTDVPVTVPRPSQATLEGRGNETSSCLTISSLHCADLVQPEAQQSSSSNSTSAPCAKKHSNSNSDGLHYGELAKSRTVPEDESHHFSSEDEADVFEEDEYTSLLKLNKRERKQLLVRRRNEKTNLILQNADKFSVQTDGHYRCDVCKVFYTNGLFRLSKHFKKHLITSV